MGRVGFGGKIWEKCSRGEDITQLDTLCNVIRTRVYGVLSALFIVCYTLRFGTSPILLTAPLRSVPFQSIIMPLPIDAETREELIQTAIQGHFLR